MQSTVPEIPVEQAASFARVSGAAYMVSVSIKVGATTLSLDPEFFKDGDMDRELKKNGVKSKETLPIFEVLLGGGEKPIPGKRKSKNDTKFSLAMAGQTLSNSLDPIQREYMLCSGNQRWWFFPESKHDDVVEKLQMLEDGFFSEAGELMRPGRQQLLVQLKRFAPDAFKLLDARLKNILGKAGKLEYYPTYIDRFPSEQELEENFRIEIEGPIRVPSVAEMADQTPEYRQFLQQIREQMQRDFPEWLNKAAASMALFLGRYQTCDPENITDKQAALLSEAYARLETDAEMHDSMGFLDIHPARKVLEKCLALTQDKVPNIDLLKTKLAALKDELSRFDWVMEPTSKGTKDLARWCGVLTLEDRIKAFKEEVKACETIADPASKQEALEKLQLQVRSFGGVLLTTANYLLAEVGLPPEQLMLDMGVPVSDQLESNPESNKNSSFVQVETDRLPEDSDMTEEEERLTVTSLLSSQALDGYEQNSSDQPAQSNPLNTLVEVAGF